MRFTCDSTLTITRRTMVIIGLTTAKDVLLEPNEDQLRHRSLIDKFVVHIVIRLIYTTIQTAKVPPPVEKNKKTLHYFYYLHGLDDGLWKQERQRCMFFVHYCQTDIIVVVP